MSLASWLSVQFAVHLFESPDFVIAHYQRNSNKHKENSIFFLSDSAWLEFQHLQLLCELRKYNFPFWTCFFASPTFICTDVSV